MEGLFCAGLVAFSVTQVCCAWIPSVDLRGIKASLQQLENLLDDRNDYRPQVKKR